MILRIKRYSQTEWLILYIFALPFALSFLIDILHIPQIIKYTIDLVLIMLLILYTKKKNFRDTQVLGVMRVVVVFLLLTAVNFVLEYQSLVYYLWGIRNNMRFFLFFMLCAMMLKQDSADAGMRLIDGLFYINLIVTLYQIFVLNAHQDRVGGIFGSSRGCNAYTNIYLMIITAWHMLRYMNYQETFLDCMIKCGISLLIAALAELKMFFLEFALITVLATLITKFSFRKLWAVIGASVGLVVGVELLKAMFPFFANWFQWEAILEYVSSDKGYANVNDVNRLSALTISWNQFLETWPQKLLGLGLGNCDYSSNFDFLTTPFYMANGKLNYTWFSSAFMMLETGILGLLLYVFFFIRVYIAARAVEKRGAQQPIYCQLARIIALMGPVLIFYNSSLRMECAYMFYFILALPFIQQPSKSTAEKIA